ncbi:thiamine pyrophosphate-binding protein [Streptomyces sp. NPDC101237]|uniref:thiamine pyrophosphate-binding protein n=1 Tax=Streptomyces sp. NPDC101237 TaxID=3366139 RepID=UPI003821D04D
MAPVSDAFYGILRHHGVKAVFGNPGSNELSFLTGLPDDIPYYLVLQEGAVAAGDGPEGEGRSGVQPRPGLAAVHGRGPQPRHGPEPALGGERSLPCGWSPTAYPSPLPRGTPRGAAAVRRTAGRDGPEVAPRGLNSVQAECP